MRRINVEITENTKDMNPLIFGHFVEFMRDCIDEGMWAQVLKNRGFDKRKDIPEGVVDGNPEVADGWVRTGSKNTFEIELDAEESLARDGHAQRINCYNAYDGCVGIAQNDLYLENKEYSGYIWMKASGNVEVEVCVREKEGGKIFSETFRVDDTWKKYEFTFCPEQRMDRGTFEIILPGEGEIWLDSASIMPSDNMEGIWKKVFEHICGLEPPIIRYPGGCFADCYHFEDGIGDIDTRPYRRNRHWGGFTDNSFGTDEFVSFCRRIGCEPMICVNFGSGTPEEAADWVEYCNGAPDTPFGRLRRIGGQLTLTPAFSFPHALVGLSSQLKSIHTRPANTRCTVAALTNRRTHANWRRISAFASKTVIRCGHSSATTGRRRNLPHWMHFCITKSTR